MGKLRSIEELSAGRHFDRKVTILCVRWYLRHKLSFRDPVEMMAGRGLYLAHTTILRWVRRSALEFIKRWDRFSTSAGRSWRVDETCIKIRGQRSYPDWAVDKSGQTIDFRLSRRRHIAAAKAFFMKAIRHEGSPPHMVTLDGYAASHRAGREMRTGGLLPKRTKLRSFKYLNNIVEQDHRESSLRPDPCSTSRTSNPLPQPSLSSNCSVVSTRTSSLARLRLKGKPAPTLWNLLLAA